MNNWYLHDGVVYRGRRLRRENLLVINGTVAAFGHEAKAGFEAMKMQIQRQ